MTWVVVGLGNPGERYADTRHNVGRFVLGALAEDAGARFKKAKLIPVDVAELRVGGERVLLAESHAYMNESGPSYGSIVKRAKSDPEHVICVHDDINLAFGALRIKMGGSTAGHNGLNSLVGALRTPDFYRVRLGVGRPSGRQDPVDFVLEPFRKTERDEVGIVVREAADAVTTLITEGLERAQDRFNRNGVRD